MNLELVPHPATPPAAVDFVRVAVQRRRTGLELSYVVEGDPVRLIVPPPAKPYRADGLWRSTCMELFVRDSQDSYRELNFSPSGQWAAYRFQTYRGEAEPLGLDEPPAIHFTHEPFGLLLSAIVAIDLGEEARLGLSAVIEESDGRKSYWGLDHPSDAPDFHHPDGFALELPPA